MKDLKITAMIQQYSHDELPAEYQELVDAAKAAAFRAYAPYSHFHVGAAILMANGEVICGSNQENAAFGAGTCAERSACFFAASQYPGMAMKKVAVTAYLEPSDPSTDRESWFQEEPVAPCGVCRQALLEYETLHGDIEVILYGKKAVYVLPSIKSLLPLSFTEF